MPTPAALISKIRENPAFSADEKAALIELLNTRKKYGLVWEDKPEDVEEQLRSNYPVLEEVPERRILASSLKKVTASEEVKGTKATKAEKTKASAPAQIAMDLAENPNSSSDKLNESSIPHSSLHIPHSSPPNHVLIEGDNLHALNVLAFTHASAIDVIYIDPPYNTGNKDFKYNDRFVDREDNYRHSKWLSFMEKRLKIAKQLLKETGVIFISIDDNEQAQLKLLCDEIFGEENFVGNAIWKRRASSGLSNYKFSTDHEYVSIYRSAEFTQFTGIEKTFEKYSNPDNDQRGEWIADNLTVGMGKDLRPNQFYPLVDPKTGIVYQPNPNRVWAYIPESMNRLISEERIIFPKSNSQRPMLKRFRKELKILDNPVSSLLNQSFTIGLNSEGTRALQDFELSGSFVYPKPTSLTKALISLNGSQDATILDFFAGSGTTLHATMQLNAEDGGNRQCILVTNNENRIAEEVCYERNKRVIEGYTNSKGEIVPGLTNNNLRYFRCGFVPNQNSPKNRRDLVRQSTDLLCIKEDCYAEMNSKQAVERFNAPLEIARELPSTMRLFEGSNAFMLVIYDELSVEYAVELIKTLPFPVSVYTFSPDADPYTDEFDEVKDKITLCALPDAILQAYRRVAPKKRMKKVEEDDDGDGNDGADGNDGRDGADGAADLFSTSEIAVRGDI